MFSLSKKNQKAQDIWRPDFRIVDRLPDTKPIRTRFLVNIVVIGIAFILLVVNAYREYQIFSLNASINTIWSERDDRSLENEDLYTKSIEFRQEANKVDDLDRFFESPFDPIGIIVQLARIRTEDLIFDNLSYRNSWDANNKREFFEINISGNGRTTADIGELKNRLEILELYDGYVLEVVEEGNPTKDVQTGVFSFSLVVTIYKQQEGNNG